MHPLPNRILNDEVSGPNGEPAVMIEAIEVWAGQTVHLTFEKVNSSWRQGVWLAAQYSCNDIGRDPKFDKPIFRVCVAS